MTEAVNAGVSKTALTEIRLREFEESQKEVSRLEREQSQLPQVPAQAMRPQIEAAKKAMLQRQLAAFKSVEVGDLDGFIRALGVHVAYRPCRVLGVSSLRALVTCMRAQFRLLSRPIWLGWLGGDSPDMIPAVQEDIDTVARVEAVLRAHGLRFREKNEKKHAMLPEPVLARVTIKGARFTDADFSDYAHPAVVNGQILVKQAGQRPISLVQELARRAIYTWEDLESRTATSLKESGLHEYQFRTVAYECERRGIVFQREVKPTAVEIETVDVDRMDPTKTREVTNISVEDKINVRDKDRKLVGIINEESEFRDRIGTQEDLANQGGSYESIVGILDEIYEAGQQPEEEDVPAEEREEVPPEPQGASLVPPTAPEQK